MRGPARYKDRADAGRQLAASLSHLRGQGVLILALPRGGVPVAAPLARDLDAALDVLVVRKLGAPGQPELGVGAIAEAGVAAATPSRCRCCGNDPDGDFRVLDEEAIARLGITRNALAVTETRERAELVRRAERYRGAQAPPRVEGRIVVLVDDGIATGGTARVAILALRARRAGRIILASPVAPPDVAAALRPLVDELICPLQPEDFRAVGHWYDDFSATSDEEVARLLADARAARPFRG